MHGAAARWTRPDAATDETAYLLKAIRIVALGESMLDREQRGGVLMTIDVFPVRAVAGAGRRRPGRRCSAARLRTRSVICCWAAPSIRGQA